MIKNKTYLSALMLGVSLCAAEAIDFNNSNSLTVSTNTVTTNELWQSADLIDFQGTARQDLFLLADQLKLGGTFDDDVWGGAASAQFTGTSKGSVRLAAHKSATIDGQIGQNLIVAVPNLNNSTIRISENSAVTGSAFCFGDNVIFEGTANDLTIYANKITLGGEVTGDVLLVASDIIVMNKAKIGGDLNYISSKELLVHDSVQLGGEIKAVPLPVKPGAGIKQRLITQCYFFVAALLVMLPFLNLCPTYIANAVALFRLKPWRCLLVGFASMFIVPLICATLCGSLIGLPLGLIIGCWYATLIYLSKIVFALIFGVIIFRWKKVPSPRNTVTAAIVGLLLIYLLTIVPFMKGPIWLMTAMYGTGALILATFRRIQFIVPTPPIPDLSTDKTETK
jgi:hypothetical protein